MSQKLWLTPEEAREPAGYKSLQSLWRDLREGKFPWDYRKAGSRYKISARSLGVITDTQNKEAQDQDQRLATAA